MSICKDFAQYLITSSKNKLQLKVFMVHLAFELSIVDLVGMGNKI